MAEAFSVQRGIVQKILGVRCKRPEIVLSIPRATVRVVREDDHEADQSASEASGKRGEY